MSCPRVVALEFRVGAEQLVLGAVGDQAGGAARVLLEGPGLGDGIGELELGGEQVVTGGAGLGAVRPTAAISGSPNTTRGMPS